jgi:transcriptional regulator with GAF, ATPase, and Fis domain
MTADAKCSPVDATGASAMIEDLWDRFSEVVLSMGAADGLTQALESVVAGAKSIIEPVDHAAVSLVHRHQRINTPAATDGIARRGDQLQYDAGEGPCLQAIRDREVVSSSDLLDEVRWPRWSRRAAEELGVRSMLCLHLFVSHDTLGALNLYSDRPHAFTAEDRTTGLALAANVAMALNSEQSPEARTTSVAGAAIIAQAQGLLMHRYELPPSGAFLVLAKAAQREDTTLRLVARTLVDNALDRRGELRTPAEVRGHVPGDQEPGA